MTKIPRNRQSDQNISKPLKWPQYHRNIQNDKNKLETYQITKIPLKPPKQPKYPKMTKILLKPPKWSKYTWNHQNTSGAECQLIWSFWGQNVISRKSGISVISLYLKGVNVYHFSFYFPSSTKLIQKNSICFLFWDKAIPNIQPP